MSMTSALAFFELSSDEHVKKLLSEKEKTNADTDKRRFLCAACSHPITDPAQHIIRNGTHQHEFTNPHGLAFRIGCFATAPGCIQVGPATEQWSWFPGFAWRIALCRQCRTHLGWGYRSTDGEGFFGLILDRLTVAQ